MEIVVGVTQDSQSSDALTLASALATAVNANLVVANIYPVAYQYASMAHIDAEWQAFLIEQSHETLDWAREILGDRDGVNYCLQGNRSSGIGLIEVAEERAASAIVIGSAPGGSDGRINGGSTSDQLFHASPVPAVIVPHGYSKWAPARIERAVVAYQRTRESDYAVDTTVELVRRNSDAQAAIYLVTVIERVTRIFGSRLGRVAEDEVLESLRAQARESLAIVADRLRAEGIRVETALAEGDTVTSALASFDWDNADLLVIGSTDAGPLRRVFLGDMTYKLIRAATVPVAVIPRSSEAG